MVKRERYFKDLLKAYEPCILFYLKIKEKLKMKTWFIKELFWQPIILTFFFSDYIIGSCETVIFTFF